MESNGLILFMLATGFYTPSVIVTTKVTNHHTIHLCIMSHATQISAGYAGHSHCFSIVVFRSQQQPHRVSKICNVVTVVSFSLSHTDVSP